MQKNHWVGWLARIFMNCFIDLVKTKRKKNRRDLTKYFKY